jgi:dCMP deaminase
MMLAINIGERSTCNVPHRQVGCVIVSEDNTKVLSLGYNGGAKGDDNSCEYDTFGTGDAVKIGTSRCTCVHAEMNALTKLDTSNPCYKKMYLTLSPCNLCYKLVVNAGINEVIYYEETRPDNLDRLRELGVKVRVFDENN